MFKRLRNVRQSVLHVTSVLFLSASVISVSAVAQDPNENKTTEVYVTASKGLESDALSIPQSTSVISNDDLAVTEYQDVDDALRTLPNIGLAPSEGNPNYWQEGFTIRGLGSQRVLVLSDGIRQAGQGIGYGGGNLSLYDPYEIERIEVLRGSSSVLYGTDSFGGVINIITKEPIKREAFGTNSGVRFGYNGVSDQYRVGAHVDVGDKDYGLLVSGSLVNAGRPNLPDDAISDNGSYRGSNLNTKFVYNIDDHRTLKIFGGVNDNRDILAADRPLTLPIASFPPPGSSKFVTSNLDFNIPLYQRSDLGVEYAMEDPDCEFSSFKSGFYWQTIRRNFNRNSAFYVTGDPGFRGPPTFVDPNAAVGYTSTYTNDRTNTFEWNNQATFTLDNHVILTGVDLGLDVANQRESSDTQIIGRPIVGQIDGPTSPVEDRTKVDADQYRVGVFAQDTISLDDGWSVIPGLRFDYVAANDKQTTADDSLFGASGSLAFNKKIQENYSTYLNLTHGFRAPDLGERFQDTIVNFGAPSRVIGNADLDSEESWGTEVGVKGRDGIVSFDAAAFGSLIEDYIGRKSIGVVDNFFTQQYDNEGEVALYGGEGRVTVAATDSLSFFGSAGRTYTNSKDVVDVPDWTFGYGASYYLPVSSKVVKAIVPTLQFRTVLSSEDRTPNSGSSELFSQGAFTVANLLLNVELGDTGFGTGRLVGGIRNLFGKEYKEPFFDQLQPERNLYAGVELNF